MSENINELTEIQGSDLEGSAQPTDSTVGRSDPTGVPVKKFPLLTIILFIFLSLLAALAIYLFLQVRTLTLEKITPSPTPSPIASADQNIGNPPSACIPRNEGYSANCREKQSESLCLDLDLYNQQTGNLNDPDGIADCEWKEPVVTNPSPSCGACPQLTPRAPDFCKDGTIVSGKTNPCGCSLGPECIKK